MAINNGKRHCGHYVGIVHHPITRRLHPEIKIGIANPRRAERIARCNLITAKDRCCNLR